MKTLRSLAAATVLVGGVTLASGVASSVVSATTVKNCLAAHLRVSVGQSQGTAGTIYYPIVFTNAGPACALWGAPAIQPVVGGPTHSHVAVGPAARYLNMGAMPVRHVIATGKSVSGAFGVSESGNYTPSLCGAKTAHAIVVTLAGFVPSRYLPLTISVCTKRTSTTTRLLVAGTTGY